VSTDERTDPYPDHRFEVDIRAEAVPVTGFSEVRGLSLSVETGASDTAESRGWVGMLERDAGWGWVSRSSVGAATTGQRPTDSPPLELRRGVTDDGTLWDWFQRWIDGTADPADARVILLDSTGVRRRVWVCKRARPVRWRGPRLTAAEPGVATETYELAHDGIEATEPGEE